MKRNTNAGKTPAIEGLFKKPDDVESPLKIAIYGRSGTGKTTFSTTLPTPILHIDINEDTSRVLKGIEGIETVSIDKSTLLDDVYWYLHDSDKYNSIVIDTVSKLQEMHLQEYQSALKSLDGNYAAIGFKGWGMISGKTRVDIGKFCRLGKNLCFIAQDRKSSEESPSEDEEITPEIGPALMPSVASFLNASVDVLGNCFIRKKTVRRKRKIKGKIKIDVKTSKEYSMRLGAHTVYTVKVRNKRNIVVPDFITDPTFDKLIDITEGNYNG